MMRIICRPTKRQQGTLSQIFVLKGVYFVLQYMKQQEWMNEWLNERMQV